MNARHPNGYAIRALGQRADTILRKARELAADINEGFGYDSAISDFADNVVGAAEDLAEGLVRLPGVLKAEGRS